jgi:DNA repair protein RAD7
LKTLKVFGNFGVKDVKVPKGRILIGVPNALGMQIEGTGEVDGEGRVI